VKQTVSDEIVLRRYVLGQVSEEEQHQVEARYFEDEAFLQQLLVTEQDLMGAYIRHELSPGDRQQFEQHFLTIPRRRREVELAEAFGKAVESLGQPIDESSRAPRLVQSALRWPGASRASARWLAVAAGLLMLLGGSWLALENRRLRATVAETLGERSELNVQRRRLQTQADSTQARVEQLTEDIQRERAARVRLEQSIASRQASRGIISLVLLPGVSREVDDQPRLVISPQVSTVVLQLELDKDDTYDGYRAELRTGDRTVWTQDLLKPSPRQAGAPVLFPVPASRVSAGDYLLMLRGLRAGADPADVASYQFWVVKK